MNDFQRYVAEEYIEQYRDGQMNRRSMLRRIGLITGSAAMAVGFLKELGVEASADEVMAAGPEYAPAGQQKSAITVQPDDPAIRAGSIVFSNAEGAPVIGYLARPAAGGANQGVLIVHENRGPTEHILDVTRRFARDGFTALSVDLLSRAGGVGSIVDAAQVPATLTADTARNMMDLQAGAAALVAREDVRPGGIGVTGYCFGGGLVWRMATTDPNVVAAAPYYGIAPPLDSVPNIRGPVLAIYAEDDERINASWVSLKEALDANGKSYEVVVYPGTKHAFHNDTGASYSADAAKDAYQRTTAWFKQYLPQA